MDCEEAFNLTSARLDGELGVGELVALDAHLATCAACRATAEAMEVQDAALVRAFAPRRLAAAALAERVAERVAPPIADEVARVVQPAARPRQDSARPRLIRWAGVAGAVAAGVVLLIMVRRPAIRRPGGALPPMAVQPVARMTLATGQVFTCPSGGREWQPVGRGEAVAAGARVRTTGASKCEVQLSDGACVRLNADTEACFAGRRSVQIASGELCSIVPPEAPPLRVTAGQTVVSADGAGGGPGGVANPPRTPATSGTQLDLVCTPKAATISVFNGTATVACGAGSPATLRTLRGGESLHVPAGTGAATLTPVVDPLLGAGWQDELLVLKPGDDPEVAARVAALLARISAERAASATTRPGPVEEEVRARGEAWSSPLACFVCSRPGSNSPAPAGRDEQRRTAARLLADLAPPWCVPDLIELLSDEDGEVRYHAAVALRRLTARDLGYSPERCAAGDSGAAAAAWRAWWKANQGRYPSSR